MQPLAQKTTMPSDLKNVHIIDHPLIQHKLTILRNKETVTTDFRRVLKELSMLLGYEVTKDFPIEYIDIETPLQKMKAPVIGGKKICLVSILRAGNGILDGMLDIMPSAKVGHIGLYRDPVTLTAVEYYFKMPNRIHERELIVVDPMLATSHSAVAAINRLKEENPLAIKFVCILSSPEGITEFQKHHPDVPIYTASVDECLNEKGYILPGLGDAGDRIYGTQ